MTLHGHEVYEQTEHSRAKGGKRIGLTIAVLAVLSACVTILMSENNTKKVVIEVKTADWWAYAHSNAGNARLYEVAAKIAQLIPETGVRVAAELRRERDDRQKISHDARLMAQELERQSAALSRQQNYYSTADLLVQLSVVLCSIALLTDLNWFWKSSFASTAVGLLLAIVGALLY
ncbi:MAG: DUF4337 family protein [Syntrophobacteraceae bacterium]|nr:DUF4337 family protein [Syntrophobacteraceae bacterium]